MSVLEPCVQNGEPLKGELSLPDAIWRIYMSNVLTGAGLRVGGRVLYVDAVDACAFCIFVRCTGVVLRVM